MSEIFEQKQKHAHEVNTKKPPNETFSPFVFYFGKSAAKNVFAFIDETFAVAFYAMWNLIQQCGKVEQKAAR